MQSNIKSKTVHNVVRFGKDRRNVVVVGCAIWLRTCLASQRASYLALSWMQSLRHLAERFTATAAAAARPHYGLALASPGGARGQRTRRRATAPDIG